jgi:hypothetical protein
MRKWNGEAQLLPVLAIIKNKWPASQPKRIHPPTGGRDPGEGFRSQWKNHTFLPPFSLCVPADSSRGRGETLDDCVSVFVCTVRLVSSVDEDEI